MLYLPINVFFFLETVSLLMCNLST